MVELTLFKENDMWTVHLGKYPFEAIAATHYPLIPASQSLYRLVTAIHNIYPDSKVWIDPNITDNPFLHHSLFTTRHYGLTPIYENVQATIDNSHEKVCDLCGSRACYNSHLNGWQCTRAKCSARESPVTVGQFIRPSRNARR